VLITMANRETPMPGPATGTDDPLNDEAFA
jgi:hypothetical protein